MKNWMTGFVRHWFACIPHVSDRSKGGAAQGVPQKYVRGHARIRRNVAFRAHGRGLSFFDCRSKAF